MTNDPNWVDGYFSVAYLNTLYQKRVSLRREKLPKILPFNTGVLADYDKEAYNLFVKRVKDQDLCSIIDFQLRDFADPSCKDNYESMKCSRISEALLAKRNDKNPHLEKGQLPTYNNPNPKPEKQRFFSRWGGGKRKQRRNKTNKLRTRTATKNIKNTKKKNKRANHSKKAKHSKKANKARKSRNARKTRKH